MPSRVGTPSQVDASAGDSSTSVTVPSDATYVVAFWAHWDNNGGSSLSALTLNGVGFTIQSQLAEGAVGDESGVGVATLANPATGSQTLAWTWSAGGARTEGGEIVLVYCKDVHRISPVRDSGVDANIDAGNVTVTIDTEPTDLVLAFGESFTPTNPALDATVFIDNGTINSHIYDLSQITPGSPTTAVNMTGEDFSTIAAISLRHADALLRRALAPQQRFIP